VASKAVGSLNQAEYNDKNLYLFWTANDSSRRMWWSRYLGGQYAWFRGANINWGDSTPEALTVCLFKNVLYLFWKSNDEANHLYFTTYYLHSEWVPPNHPTPGHSVLHGVWENGRMINQTDTSPFAPAACVFDDQLYLFWKANDPSNAIYYAASPDGVSWPNGVKINHVDSSPMAPAAYVFGQRIFLFWKANDPSNRIYYSVSDDGVT
jgi:hypothetical protein